ncbi:MAG: glycosyltransferase, partial [Eubacteriales bacterium]
EGLPLNIVEAMMSGTPVVATYNRGHRELIQDEKNGYLICGDNIEQMGKKVLELLADTESAHRMKQQAQDDIVIYGKRNVQSELTGIYFSEGKND